MQRFKSPEHGRRFLPSHAIICGHFRPRRHLHDRRAAPPARDKAVRMAA
jgi:putative transposase